MSLTEEQIATMMANRDESLLELDKYECSQSLLRFMQLGWASLEPGVKFVASWGVEAICDHLEAVTRGDITRLLINVPPGCTKSMTTSVFWPAWEWGPKELPHYRYINFAHEQNLAIRDNVRGRNLVNSPWYQSMWGDQFCFDTAQNAKMYYENNMTGWRRACAAASLTGHRGDRVIGDDPHSVRGADHETERENVLQVFAETVPTRLNKQDESAIVVIMQRVHERDVSGLILEKELGYEHLMLPMEFEEERRCFTVVPPSYMIPKKELVYFDRSTFSWKREEPETWTKKEERYCVDKRETEGELLDPIRFPPRSIKQLKATLSAWGGTYAEAGQLQQRPAPRGGGLFQKKDFIYIDDLKDFKIKKRVRGWDLAATVTKKAAYTCGVKMALTACKSIIILDVERFKGTPGIVEQKILSTAKADGVGCVQDLPQDPGQSGKVQKTAHAKLLHGFIVKSSPESGSKEDRAGPLAAQCEGGNVYLLRGDWNDPFVNEAASFPNGQFKDQIDGASRAYANILIKKARRIAGGPVVVEDT